MRIWVPPDPTTPIRTIGQIRVLVLYVTPGGPTERASAMAREPGPSRGLLGFCTKLETLH